MTSQDCKIHARRDRRTFDVYEALYEVEILAFGNRYTYHRLPTYEAVYSYVWDKLTAILWELPVAPLYWLRGGLSEWVRYTAFRVYYLRDPED